MDFYNPGLCEGLEFYDNSNKKDANLTENDIQGTIKSIKKEVDDFKEKYPKGAVVLLSHMGGRLSEIIRSNIPQINHILNGHDHKTFDDLVGKTLILSHGQGGEFYRGIHFNIEDDGSVHIHSDKYMTSQYDQPARKDKKMQEYLRIVESFNVR